MKNRIMLFAILFFVSLFVFSNVRAMAETEKQILISQITQQISVLQAQLNAMMVAGQGVPGSSNENVNINDDCKKLSDQIEVGIMTKYGNASYWCKDPNYKSVNDINRDRFMDFRDLQAVKALSPTQCAEQLSNPIDVCTCRIKDVSVLGGSVRIDIINVWPVSAYLKPGSSDYVGLRLANAGKWSGMSFMRKDDNNGNAWLISTTGLSNTDVASFLAQKYTMSLETDGGIFACGSINSTSKMPELNVYVPSIATYVPPMSVGIICEIDYGHLGEWSACINNKQTRTFTYKNNCASPGIATQSCVSSVTTYVPPVLACASSWQASVWSACINGEQTKTYIDTNACTVPTSTKPQTQIRSCGPLVEGVTCNKFTRNLTLGSKGEDVSALESILKTEIDGYVGGIYYYYENGLNRLPEYTRYIDKEGFFGGGMMMAVIKFQEKYASDILAPSGLKKGNGNVDDVTRKKLNQIYNCPAIGILYPNTGNIFWKTGETQTITWDYIGIADNEKINIDIFDVKKQQTFNIAKEIDAGSKKYSFVVPEILQTGNSYRARIYVNNNLNLIDESDYDFRIEGPSVEIALPAKGLSNSYEQQNQSEKQLQEIISDCKPRWECSQWTPCNSGKQTRICTSFCATDPIEPKPLEIQSCLNETINSELKLTWCHNFENADIKIGDKGDEVLALQTALWRSGYFGDGSNRTGIFDGLTYNAVVSFQKRYSSEILAYYPKDDTGVIGPKTRLKLNKLYGCNVVCGQDLNKCPEGSVKSYVTRIGPNCEFEKCVNVFK